MSEVPIEFGLSYHKIQHNNNLNAYY